MSESKKQARIVVYDDPEFYKLFMATLQSEGMTLSGWYRKMARKFVADTGK